MGYTLKQASELMGLSTKTLRRKIASGELIATKQQGKVGEEYVIEIIPGELLVKQPPITNQSVAQNNGQEIGVGSHSYRQTAGQAVDSDATFHELLKLVRKLQEENAALHEKIGELNATVQMLSSGRLLPMTWQVSDSAMSRSWRRRLTFWRR